MAVPCGWLVRMKQYLRRPSEQFDLYEKQFERLKNQSMLYTAFGNFDRIEFVPISRFSDYRRQSATDKSWYGKRQSIILYAVDGGPHLFQTDTSEEKRESSLMEIGTDGVLRPMKCQFFIHTMLHISGSAKSYVRDYRHFLELIRSKILELVQMYREKKENQNEQLDCEIFGTFNSAEVAVLWAADQFSDVLFLLDELRHMRFVFTDEAGIEEEKEIFLSTYTVISGNPYIPSPDAKGSAMVQLECTSKGKSFEETSKFIEKAIREALHASGSSEESGALVSCAGEYDYIVELPFSAIPYLFPYACAARVKDTFSIHNEEFARYIRQTTTRLFYCADDIDSACRALSWEEVLRISLSKQETTELCNHTSLNVIDYIDQGEGSTYMLYQLICRELEQKATYSGTWKTLELLYSDYVTILCTAVDHLWVKDFNEQFVCALHIILSLLQWIRLDQGDCDRRKIEIFTSQFGEICSILQQQVNHISESSKLFFEVPNSKLGYTAQFDLVLHSYYGIVKELMLNAYGTERASWQYPLIPVINFANTPIIESKMFSTVDGEPEKGRLISIAFPYDSWSNPLYYTPFLLHEVHHYVAPRNRRKRNAAFLTVILHRICMQWVRQTAYYQIMQRDGKILSDMDCGKRDSIGADVQKIAVKLEPYVFDIIFTKQEILLDQICEESCSVESCPAYELRNRLVYWLGEKKRDERIKLIKELIEKGLEALEKDSGDDEPLEYRVAHDDGSSYKWEDKHFYREFEESSLDVACSSLEALREIFPDLSMIAGTAMELPEYLLQFATLQVNLLTHPSAMDDWEELALRLGPIMHYFLKATDSLEKQQEAFLAATKEFERLFPLYLHDSGLSSGNENSDEVAVLAKGWSDFFRKVHGHYRHRLTIYNHIIDTQVVDQYDLRSLQTSSISKLYKQYWQQLRSRKKEDDCTKKVFNIALQLIHMHQNQYSLKQLSELNDSQGAALSTEDKKPTTAVFKDLSINPKIRDTTEFYLDCKDNLFEVLRKILRQMRVTHLDVLGEECGPGSIWYRGISNSKYHILPSLFVNYHKNAKYQNGKLSKTPYQILLHNYQQFKFRSDGAPELYSRPSYQSSDYLALMQHYQIQTTMMDWSEDAFAALYFALEKYVQFSDCTKWTDNPDEDAALYLFDPAIYNWVRRRIICSDKICIHKNHHCPNWCDYVACMNFRREVGQTIDEELELVPNVSIGLNRDAFAAMFFDKKVETPFPPIYDAKDLEGYSPINSFPLCFSLPIAVYTSRLNPRIRAQSGQFLVYQPYTVPVLQDGELGKECFDYVALDTLQEKWLREKPGERPFLIKLSISRAVKSGLGEQLRYMGIKTSNYYPELPNEHFSLDR